MRSATSFFDKTLFRSQLKHTWPLWLGYTALWLFLVPVMLFSELSAYQLGYSAADASYLLLNTGVRGGIFISFFFGLFFAMLAFSHLTQSRATNGFHALPVRRETIFLTAYLTGLFCQLSTILVTFLLGAAAQPLGEPLAGGRAPLRGGHVSPHLAEHQLPQPQHTVHVGHTRSARLPEIHHAPILGAAPPPRQRFSGPGPVSRHLREFRGGFDRALAPGLHRPRRTRP